MAIFGVDKEKVAALERENQRLTNELKVLEQKLKESSDENSGLKKQLGRYDALRSAVLLPYVVIDAEKNIEFANAMFCEMLNLDAASVRGKSCYDVLGAKICFKGCSPENCLFLGRARQENKIISITSGSRMRKFIVVACGPVKKNEGPAEGAYALLDDMTDLVEKEEQNISIFRDKLRQNEGLLDPPKNVESTGLRQNFLSDLALKVLYTYGIMTGREVSDFLCLPYANVTDKILESLKDMKYCYTLPAKSAAMTDYSGLEYKITDLGMHHAREVMDKDQYVGPAPVPISRYREVIEKQKKARKTVTREDLRAALKDMEISDSLLRILTVAVNSGESIFLYGRPGNGKTTIAKCCGNILRENVLIPHAIEIDGQVIKVLDPAYHIQVENISTVGKFLSDSGYIKEAGAYKREISDSYDRRWVLCKSPFVAVGGELTLAELDLIYNPVVKYYEAPFQIKANGGVLLIDDFGRQRVRPEDLLNRWIVPLEEKIDYMTLSTGKKVVIPIDQLIIFSTNLKASNLGDEAFYRRLKNKIYIKNPTREQFIEIFKSNCAKYGFQYSSEMAEYLIEKIKKTSSGLRAYFPRDILINANSILEVTGDHSSSRTLSREIIDEAFDNCFLEKEED